MSTIAARSNRQAGVAMTMIPIAVLGACSTGGQRLTRSGFLPDYSEMQPTSEHKRDAIFVAEDYQPTRYTKVIVEPVEWRAPGRKEETRAKLKSDFRNRLVRELGKRYQIVEPDEAGPGVLRVRSAITNTRPGRWYYNLPAQAAQVALGGLGLFRPSSGGASEEMQVQDSENGRSLVQIATFRNGKPWDITGSYVAYDHARAAFTQASKLLTKVTVQTGDRDMAASAKVDWKIAVANR